MTATSQRRLREPSLLARYGAQMALLLEQKESETALLAAQQEAQHNANNVILARKEARAANEQLQAEKEQLLLAQSRLEYTATHDSLTALPNRMFFNQRLHEAVDVAAKENGNLALFYIDIHHLKNVNETLGHEIGDAFLKETARRLMSFAGEHDVVARISGNEFALLRALSAQDNEARDVADQLDAALCLTFIVSEHTILTAASIGIALFPHDGTEATLLQRNADVALHRCKQEGRAGHQFFNMALDQMVHRRTFLEKALRAALRNGEMSVVYQPQVSFRTRKVTGVEALLRWNSAECGAVSPDEFIPIAERSGLIAELGAWVLGESCRQAILWDAAGLPSLTMAVNVSVPQLQLASLPEMVENVLRETGLASSRLVLEITETQVMRDMKTSLETLRRLRGLGIKLAIDDFGTGYSSLSYLRRLPIDKIKIDKSFVTDVTQNVDAATIASTIVTLARNLRLTVIAEGVETIEQEKFLQEIGCHSGQGYYYGKPSTPVDFASRFGVEATTE